MSKMINYHHVAQMAFNTPLLATHELADSVTAFLRSKIVGEGDGGQISAQPASSIPVGDPEQGDHMVVIPVHGVLVPRRGQITAACEEVMSYELLRSHISAALDDDNVKEIILDIDSGGGTAQAAFECAEFIYQSREIKPIRAIVNFNAFSGAYLIASACTEIIASDTSGVGSIGVYQKRWDYTQALNDEGVKIHTFFRGAKKVHCHPDMEMTEEERASTEESIEKCYMKFVGAVARYRGLSENDVIATEADRFEGEEALSIGLVDRVATPQAAINQIAQSLVSTQQPRRPQSIAIQAAHLKMKSQL